MSRYKNDILHFNYWEVDSNGTEKKWEYACKECEMKAVIADLEKNLKTGIIVDYEMYGFANFTNPFTKFGDRIFIREATTQKQLFDPKKSRFKIPQIN